jgi:hypothetical protein
MNRRSLMLMSVLALVLILPSARASRQSQKIADCGQPVGGVRLCLVATGSDLELALTKCQ